MFLEEYEDCERERGGKKSSSNHTPEETHLIDPEQDSPRSFMNCRQVHRHWKEEFQEFMLFRDTKQWGLADSGVRREVSSFLGYGHWILLRYSSKYSQWWLSFHLEAQSVLELFVRSRYIKIINGKLECRWQKGRLMTCSGGSEENKNPIPSEKGRRRGGVWSQLGNKHRASQEGPDQHSQSFWFG